MKILEAFGEPISYGGEEAFVMNILEHMDMSGISFDFLTPYFCDNDKIKDKVREYGGRLTELGCRFNPGGIRNNTIRPIRDFLRNNHYDVIHIHSGSNSMLAIYAKLAYKAHFRRIIVHAHSTGTDGIKHAISKFINSDSLGRYPTDYFACSEVAGRAQFASKTCQDELIVINNGIDADLFAFDEVTRERLREELGIVEDEIVIACVGRFSQEKNQTFLIDILYKIRNDYEDGHMYKLLLVGSGDTEHKLMERIANLKLSEAVIIIPAKDDISAYYQVADVLAVPSLYEGFGIVVLEGQAAGLEIASSDCVQRITNVCDTVSYIPIRDKKTWINFLTGKHIRHSECADIIKNSDFDIARVAAVMRKKYMG